MYESISLDDTPVGVVKLSGSAASSTLAATLYNVYSDQINTPRVITRQSDEAIVWRWDSAEAFGASAPDQNPNALGTFTVNQRFPGQLFDAESGLSQNWNREYNARTGRYIQSDPIGLRGGINTFAYVEGNPISRVDPYGLFDITNPADWPSLPPSLVNFFEGYGSYYGGLGNAAGHMYRRSGMAGSCLQQRAIENEAALAAALLALSNRAVANQAGAAAKTWASNNKAYLAGRLSAGGVTSAVTGVGPYGGLTLGLVAGMGDALHNIDRANALSAEQVLRSILGDRMPNLPDIRRTECECPR